jgi:hypothetical protein
VVNIDKPTYAANLASIPQARGHPRYVFVKGGGAARAVRTPSAARDHEPRMIIQVLNGESLPVYGDGMNIRDWLYVEDHARALALVLDRGGGGPFSAPFSGEGTSDMKFCPVEPATICYQETRLFIQVAISCSCAERSQNSVILPSAWHATAMAK